MSVVLVVTDGLVRFLCIVRIFGASLQLATPHHLFFSISVCHYDTNPPVFAHPDFTFTLSEASNNTYDWGDGMRVQGEGEVKGARDTYLMSSS